MREDVEATIQVLLTCDKPVRHFHPQSRPASTSVATARSTYVNHRAALQRRQHARIGTLELLLRLIGVKPQPLSLRDRYGIEWSHRF